MNSSFGFNDGRNASLHYQALERRRLMKSSRLDTFKRWRHVRESHVRDSIDKCQTINKSLFSGSETFARDFIMRTWDSNNSVVSYRYDPSDGKKSLILEKSFNKEVGVCNGRPTRRVRLVVEWMRPVLVTAYPVGELPEATNDSRT